MAPMMKGSPIHSYRRPPCPRLSPAPIPVITASRLTPAPFITSMVRLVPSENTVTARRKAGPSVLTPTHHATASAPETARSATSGSRMEPLTGGQIGCRFRPDAPCDGNGVMPCRPRLLNEFAANTATGTKDGYAHGASVSDEYRHWTNRDSLSKVPGHRIAAAVPAPAPLSPAHEGGTGVQVVPVVLRGRMRVQG